MLRTHHSFDSRPAFEAVEPFLLADPVRRNQLLTTFARLRDSPRSEQGQCWWVTEGDAVTGLVLQAAKGSTALLDAASSRVVESLVAIVQEIEPSCPAVVGEAGEAARFAGAWTDLVGGAAEPIEGQRLYELRRLSPPEAIPGSGRRATPEDVSTLAEWHLGFCSDVGVEPWRDPVETMRSRVAEGGVWIWDDAELVSMASATTTIAGASRIAHVYTPPGKRGTGYGAAVTAAATRARLSEGADRCLLFTQLANTTSNSIYRRLGYRAIEERVVYRLSNH